MSKGLLEVLFLMMHHAVVAGLGLVYKILGVEPNDLGDHTSGLKVF